MTSVTMLYAEDYSLKSIPSYIFEKIKSLLDHNSSWKKLEKLDEEIYKIIKPPDTLPPSTTPGGFILNTLIIKLCTMGILRELLLASELYDPLSVFYTEKIDIEKKLSQGINRIENDEIFVKRKTPFKLTCKAQGIPQPTYEWYKNNVLLVNQNSSELFYELYTPNMEGEYYCKAIQTIVNYNTNTTRIETLQSDCVRVLTKHEPCIITKIPLNEICRRKGDSDIVLEVIADGFPKPRYQWTHNNQLLVNKNLFKIPTELKYTGVYRCYISNGINELIATTVVKIIDPNFKFPVCLEQATEKVALLIGNERYANLRTLSTPVEDTKELQEKLESIGFLVFVANNLNYHGMQNAIKYFQQMVCKDSIALVYYAGHGFEFGEKYLMPIDVPDNSNYRMKNCICEYMIFREILKQKPKLLVVLLDMCLMFPNIEHNPGIFEEKKEIFEFESNRNLVRGYSTTTGYSSQEVASVKHSVYNCLLTKNITKKVPVLQMLRSINNELEKLANNSGQVKIAKQMPSITDNLSKDYYLDVEKIGYPPAKIFLDKLHICQSRIKQNIPRN